MKPFDMEAAKAGAPVVTGEGQKVRIVCFDAKRPSYPIVALVSDDNGIESVSIFTLEGCTNHHGINSRNDLFMAPVKKTGWVNIHRGSCNSRDTSVGIYLTKEQALSNVHNKSEYVATVKVEWEE